jgi:lipopolysaccharide export system protein LptA
VKGGLSSAAALLLLAALLLAGSARAERREVQIIHADAARNLKQGDVTLNRLIGNVQLLHNATTMTCDSAYLYPDNRFEAFGRVVMNKDTLWLFGDYLDYLSAIDMGKVRGRLVTLLDGATTRLRTQHLDFNTATNVAFFTQGGTIDDKQSVLESSEGYYYSDSKLAVFTRKVEMKNEGYRIKSDSLHFLSSQELATFFQQTYVWNDSVFLSFLRGYYSKPDDHFFMADHAYMMSEKQEGWGDSVHYYRLQKEGEMFGNVQLFDSAQRAVALGDYAKLYEQRELAFITQDPAAAFFSEDPKDDTLFLRADTLLVKRTPNTDTATMALDTTRKYMEAFRNVRFYHPEMQGLCDSLAYSAIDSLLEMFYAPLLWTQGNQLSAEKVEVHPKNGELHRVDLIDAGFIAAPDDTAKAFFNQVKGKLILMYFERNDLHRVDVFGSGQTVYYLRDSAKLTGVNKSESNDISIYIRKRQVHKITYLSHPVSDVLPPKELKAADLTLKGFAWQPERRPAGRSSITRRTLLPSQRQASAAVAPPTYPITRRLNAITTAFFPPSELRRPPPQ